MTTNRKLCTNCFHFSHPLFAGSQTIYEWIQFEGNGTARSTFELQTCSLLNHGKWRRRMLPLANSEDKNFSRTIAVQDGVWLDAHE